METKEDKKLGLEPAFPALEHNEAGYGDQITLNFGGERNFIPFTKGISKRLYIACMAMQGLLANTNSQWADGDSYTKELRPDLVCKAAFIFADELLAQENK